MKIKSLLCLLLIAVLLAGCNGTDEPETTDGVSMETTTEDIPGIEDNIFDLESTTSQPPEITQEPTETQEPDETEEPTREETTNPPDGGIQQPDGPSSGGIKDPEDPTQPQTPTQPQPTDPPEESTGNVSPEQLDYKTFQDMTPAQQVAVRDSFESIEAFFDWYERVKLEYEEANPPIDVGDGNIDLDEVLGGKN